MSPTDEAATRPTFNARERRVLGVLVEKQKTTPEYYPMTVSALVSGCNQKSARDPVTGYDADDVEETLLGLRPKGAVLQVEGLGRTTKWRHGLYELLDLRHRAAELAVLAELLLRGPQTEGDLRARASRMDPIPDLPALQAILEFLSEKGLVVSLSPPGQRRGVVIAHNLYPPAELERLREAVAAGAPAAAAEPRRGEEAAPGWRDEAAALRAEVQALRDQLGRLGDEVRALKDSLGA